MPRSASQRVTRHRVSSPDALECRRGQGPPVGADRRCRDRIALSVGTPADVAGCWVTGPLAFAERHGALGPLAGDVRPLGSLAAAQQEARAIAAEGHIVDRTVPAHGAADRRGSWHPPEPDRPVVLSDRQGLAVRPEREAPHGAVELIGLPGLPEQRRVPQSDRPAFGAGRKEIPVRGDRYARHRRPLGRQVGHSPELRVPHMQPSVPRPGDDPLAITAEGDFSDG